MSKDKTIRELTEQLKKNNPYKIIIFGSHASGTAGLDSDIDILVVTKDEFLPKNFAEKNSIYLGFSRSILDLQKKTPIDLIVHTRAMHRKFIELGSSFSKKIAMEGVVLYETPDH